ncbi:hypothetical protein [Candidatus Nanohalococcus occultus]|uniref:hypothetical protein n=1 Tax=Candidatus Nanohalococcus occultus TaxID=2978047 RepID=UPI0039E097AF
MSVFDILDGAGEAVRDRFSTEPKYEAGSKVRVTEGDYAGEQRTVEAVAVNPPSWMKIIHGDNAPVAYVLDEEPRSVYEDQIEGTQ